MAWEKYLDKSGRSGISDYELKDTGINVRFKNGGEYFYGIDDNGTQTIGEMMSLADNGEFLNRRINKSQPKFQRGANTTQPPSPMDSRPLNDTQVRAISDKFMWRNPSVADQLRGARWSKMQNAKNMQEYQKFRKSRY